jgi:hypothetical protein
MSEGRQDRGLSDVSKAHDRVAYFPTQQPGFSPPAILNARAAAFVPEANGRTSWQLVLIALRQEPSVWNLLASIKHKMNWWLVSLAGSFAPRSTTIAAPGPAAKLGYCTQLLKRGTLRHHAG